MFTFDFCLIFHGQIHTLVSITEKIKYWWASDAELLSMSSWKKIKTSKINTTENFCYNFCYNRNWTRRIGLMCRFCLYTYIFFWPGCLVFTLTLIIISFFPTYSSYHALVTRYLNNIKNAITSFESMSLSSSVAQRITCQTSDWKVCCSSTPGSECFYNSDEKF